LRSDLPPKIVTIGAAFSANKGAASMLQAVIDNVEIVLRGARIVVLTTYPKQDRIENPNPGVEVVSLTPRELVFPTFPLAILMFSSRLFGYRGRVFARTRALRELLDARVVADLAGISFSDGRGIPTLIYNVLMTGVPLLVGSPVVKCAQALGPFESLLNRLAARLVLPRVSEIVARGEGTLMNLSRLGLKKVTPGADLAFLMDVGEAAGVEALRVVEDLGGRPFICISPSSVLRGYCRRDGIDYVEHMARICDELVSSFDLDLVIIPHSARPGRPESRMNDIPVCLEIASAMKNGSRVTLVDRSISPAALRSLIGHSVVLVTSRFHAMISALATSTPAVILGWGHKYEEVLDSFGLKDWVIPYRALPDLDLTERVDRAIRYRDEIARQIAAHLPEVESQSAVSITALAHVVAQQARPVRE